MSRPSADMSDKVCLITGATSGIGTEAARALVAMGATVVLPVRDRQRGERVRQQIAGAADPSRVELMDCNLASQRQVREFAVEFLERHDRLDVLVNNAGLTLGGVVLTEDGIEATMAVNHLAPFLLTHLLLDLLERSAPARVVTVASDAHRGATLDLDRVKRRDWVGGWAAYCDSKLANILFTRELARRLEGKGVVANCLHPGVVRTGLARNGPLLIKLFFKLGGLFLIGPEKGAATTVYLATAPEAGEINGGYFQNCRQTRPSAAACDDAVAARLWKLSERLTGVEG